ncbi:MAG: YggS family pyridoxal phosphate-dependent enzyme [Phycisphaeraceae bacterium]|nr:YggS family pyridoxal phosphate-dependent enzyme [Phycisphaeraceae bacterium]
MTTTATLLDRYALVRDRIAEAARRSGRTERDIILVAVTKHADPTQIRVLLEAGHRDLGENKVQQLQQRVALVDEYLDRLRVLSGTRDAREKSADVLGEARGPSALPAPVRWHMIGHLQRNKAKKVVECCRLVHSIDSLRLAEEIQSVALRRDQVVDVLLQVNCSGEDQKHGCPPAAAGALAEQIDTMVNLRVRGLMTMAADTRADQDAAQGEAATRAAFSRCRDLFEDVARLRLGGGAFNLLSMGMSSDFEIAIEEGANIVRVGSAIFGDAITPDAAEDDED